jgi:NarL family two-component system response regulator LiaR
MSETHTIRVITVDDHEILRSGITFSLSAYKDLELVGEAHSGEDALQLCGETQPDVALVDMRMDGMDGVQTTRAIRKQYPQVQVLILTNFYNKELVQRAMQAGAVGYLVKGVSASDLAEAIRVAHTGQTILSQKAAKILIQPDELPDELGHDLTERELEVLALLAKGLSNAEIAKRLSISVSTVKHHVRAILLKLDAANRAESVALALQHGLIQIS